MLNLAWGLMFTDRVDDSDAILCYRNTRHQHEVPPPEMGSGTICVPGGDGGGNAVHYLQSTLTVRIPGSQRTVETAALDGEIGQSRTPC